MVLFWNLGAIANTASPSDKATSEEVSQESFRSFKEKFESFSEKKQVKIKKKLNRLKDKIDTYLAKKAAKEEGIAKEEATSGVALGLIVILAGALIAILGFAGIADFLVTIGLIILIVGLILWLVDRL